MRSFLPPIHTSGHERVVGGVCVIRISFDFLDQARHSYGNGVHGEGARTAIACQKEYLSMGCDSSIVAGLLVGRDSGFAVEVLVGR